MSKILSDKEKLAEIFRFFGLKIVDFGEKIGVNSTNIYSVNQGKSEYLNRETLAAIAKNCPEISLFWLITGEGSMLGGIVEQHNVNGRYDGDLHLTYSAKLKAMRPYIAIVDELKAKNMAKFDEV